MGQMKVVAFNGSPNREGNTNALLRLMLAELEKEGIETEMVFLPELTIQPCKACFACGRAKNGKCMSGIKDGLNQALEKMIAADGIVIGSPTHFANVSGHVKNLIDRAGIVVRMNGSLLNRKVGAAVVAVRRAGGVPAFDAINRFFQINGVVVPGAIYWGLGMGREPGQCLEDEEALRTMADLGKNFAWLLKKLA
jgi:multimeric flavodoxin WrbA